MRVNQLALASLSLSLGCTHSFAPDFSGRMPGFAPELPGQLLLGGGNSVLDMAGSYLDHLGKPSFSSSEASPAGPKKSYMYTKKNTPAKSGGQAKSGVSNVSKIGSKPKSSGFMYQGVPKTGAGSKPGVSPGNYLDNMSAGASFTTNAPISPPPSTTAAPVSAFPPPAPPGPKTIAPSGEDSWVVTNPSSYLDALGAGSSGPLKRSGGYMYKPKAAGGKKGPGGYLDNVGGSSSSSAPRGYLENIGGASSGGKRQGGYMYKPSGTGQKKSSIGNYLDNVGSSPSVPTQPLLTTPEDIEATPTEQIGEASLATVEAASSMGAPAAFEVPTLPGAPGGLNPLSGTIDRPTAGWNPAPRPDGGIPSPPNPYSGQGDRPSWNTKPAVREISGPMSPPNALAASAERLSVISASQNPAEREISGPMSPPNDLSAVAERPSAIAAGTVPREINGPMSPPNALSGQGEYPLAYTAGASSNPAPVAPAASGPKGYLDSMGGSSSGGKRQGGYMYKPSNKGQKKSSIGSYLDNMGVASGSYGAPAAFEVPKAPGAPGGLNPLSGTIDRPTAGWKPTPRPNGGTWSPPNPYSGQGDRPSWNENPVQREISGPMSPPNALAAGGPRPSEVSATPYAENAGLGKSQVGLNNVLNMGGSAASGYVSSTNPWLSEGQPVAVGGAATPPSLDGRPIAAMAQPSAAFREPSPPVPAQTGVELPRPAAPPNAGGLDNRQILDSAYPSPNSGVAPMQNTSWQGQVEEKAPPISAVAALTKNQPDFMDAFGTGTRASLQANPLSGVSSSKLGDQPSFIVQADGNNS